MGAPEAEKKSIKTLWLFPINRKIQALSLSWLSHFGLCIELYLNLFDLGFVSESFANVLPTCGFCNMGQQHTRLCLKNREERVQSWALAPPWVLWSNLCYANPSIQSTSETFQTSSERYYSMARRCYLRTAFSTQTGKCLKRQPFTTIIQIYKSVLNQWLFASKCANQKTWMTAQVCWLLKTRDEIFWTGDKAAIKTARANLSCGFKNAKVDFQTHSISSIKMQNDTPGQKLPTAPTDQTLCRINPRYATSPDTIFHRIQEMFRHTDILDRI